MSSHRHSEPALLGACILFLVTAFALGGCASADRSASAGSPKVPEIDRKDSHGNTPIINAALAGDSVTVASLLGRGAKVDSVDRSGDTALMRICEETKPSIECARILISKGADVNHPNYQGQTPLVVLASHACSADEAPNVAALDALLIASGADANRQGPSGELPLHIAAFLGQPEPVLDCLLKATKDPHATSYSGFDALSEAARGDRRETEAFLASRGFVPQDLSSISQQDYSSTELPNNVYSIMARAEAAYGDTLVSQGKAPQAMTRYEASSANFTLAIAAYNKVISQLTASLGKETDARNKKIAGTVALNVVGIGLAAVTGVGFFAVPKSMPNDIAFYKQQLADDKAGLAVLVKEDSEVEAKLRAGPPPAP